MKSAMNCFLSELPCRIININGRVINLKLSADLNYILIIFDIIQLRLVMVRTIKKKYLGLHSRFRDNTSKKKGCICEGKEGKKIVEKNDRGGSAVLF